jgi:hypothetical protein
LKILVVLVVACLWSSAAIGQSANELAAAQILGPQWKQIARQAGMIFSGTLLCAASQPTASGAVPTIELRFKVDRAIAGAHPGQVLTVREWSGSESLQRPLRPGDRVLLLLYPPSKLGLTSPVNGSSGQVALGPGGKLLRSQNIRVGQLERAIRGIREE